MTVLRVPGIHCSGCVKRIEAALKNANIDAKVCLEDRTVSVDEKDMKRAAEEIEELGFDIG
jgi:copper chaperone CopZ